MLLDLALHKDDNNSVRAAKCSPSVASADFDFK